MDGVDYIVIGRGGLLVRLPVYAVQFFHGRVTLSSTCPWPTSGLGREATRKTCNKGDHGDVGKHDIVDNDTCP